MASFDFTGKTALVTGAGGGIGRNIALGLAKRGVRGLALCDILEDTVRETASLAQALGAQVSVHVFDIADRCAIEALPAQVRDEHASIEVLVNNAGVTLGGHFDAGTIDEFEWVLTINLLGVTRMTRVFLPQLKQVPAAQIINISSLFGLIGVPGQAAYCASKFGVRGFSNALIAELDQSNVGVTVVHPGGISTEIANRARMPASLTEEQVSKGRASANKLLVMPPQQAAEIILDAAARRQERVIVGRDAKIAALFERFFPVRTWQRLSALSPKAKRASKPR